MSTVTISPSQVSVEFREKLADLLAEYMAAADLLGRLHALQNVKARTGLDLPMNTLVPVPAAQFAEVLGFEKVPSAGAIERLRNLTSYSKKAFDSLKQMYKQFGFTIAGTSDVGLIERIQAELIKVVEAGGTARDFRAAVNALTSKAGVEKLTRAHIDTAFQTTIQRAYQGGHFEQMKDPAVTAALPYWKYVTVGDGRVRASHAALDGFVARHNDFVWGRIYPPTGYNCRCTVIAILASEAPEDADIPGKQRIPAAARSVPDPGFGGKW